jgi:hypothetical protein
MEFHCPWLPIMISFIAWEEPKDAQFLGMRENPCVTVKYQNVWFSTKKRRQMENNVQFFLYVERIRQSIWNAPRMSQQLVEAYVLVVKFHVDMHHMYIKSMKDPREDWFQTKYKITE